MYRPSAKPGEPTYPRYEASPDIPAQPGGAGTDPGWLYSTRAVLLRETQDYCGESTHLSEGPTSTPFRATGELAPYFFFIHLV